MNTSFRTTTTTFFFSLLLSIAFISCNDLQESPAERAVVDADQLLADVEYLASDELEGRETGTEGNRLARLYIEERFESVNLSAFGDDYRQYFDHPDGDFSDAVNLVGYVEGTENPDRYLVVTAHYDHLGINEDGEIFNGADDNASGTGGLMAAARYFADHHPENSVMFVAFDAEEKGLMGARYFVENPTVPLEQIVMNVNMDMISTNFEDELYAVGTYHYPFLRPMIEEFTADAPIDVLFGYDSDEWPQDWTMASDHGPFHQQDVPFIYFGVEDHEHYHAPTDTFENINPEFYVKSVETIIGVIEGLDGRLDEVVEASEGAVEYE